MLGGGGGTAIFKLYSGGIKTNRDDWVYDFQAAPLAARVQAFIETYNGEVDRWKRRTDRSISIDDFVVADETKIK